jgi:hypothetical protein
LLQDYGAFSLYDPMVKTGKQRFAIGREFVYYGLKCCMNWENKKNNIKEVMLINLQGQRLPL